VNQYQKVVKTTTVVSQEFLECTDESGDFAPRFNRVNNTVSVRIESVGQAEWDEVAGVAANSPATPQQMQSMQIVR